MPFEDLDVLETSQFEEKISDIEDSELENRVDNKVEMLKDHPKRNSETLKNAHHKGMRRYRIGDYRLIYLWCGEAMEMDGVGNRVEEVIEQDHIEEDHLILIDFGKRDKIYQNYE